MMRHPTLVHPTLGTITGTHGEKGVESYLGIPYGKLSKRWTFGQSVDVLGDFDASIPGPQCPQPPPDPSQHPGPAISGRHEVNGQDEFGCLNLNVIRPTSAHGLPVLVWIHGGAFLTGSSLESTCDPTTLVQWSKSQRQPIIVVGVNYRLGTFGFLYSSALDQERTIAKEGTINDAFRGNFGLHDQRLALEWVHRNIEGFGGDPRQVTIAGQSSGGYAIHAQISANAHLSAQRSLFSGAIIQSGPLAARHIWSIKRLDRIWNLIVIAACLGGLGSVEAANGRGGRYGHGHEQGRGGEVRRVVDGMKTGHVDSNDLDLLRSVPASELVKLGSKAGVGSWGVFADGVFVSPEMFDADWVFKTMSTIPEGVRVIVGDCADERSVYLDRVASRGLSPLLDALRDELSPNQVNHILDAYQIDRHAEAMTQETMVNLSYVAQDLRYLSTTDALTTAWPNSLRYHFSIPNPFPEATSSYFNMAYHGIDTLYLFRNYNKHFSTRHLDMDLAVSDGIGTAMLTFINGGKPWDVDCGMQFGRDGVEVVRRDHVRGGDAEYEGRLTMWKDDVGMVKVGRIANLWISEQNSRGDDEFVY